jgi:hypothetical protein
VFVRPFHFDVSENKWDWFHYVKIKQELIKYKFSQLLVIAIILFTGASLHLGVPLQVAAMIFAIFVPFWTLYNYVKKDNKNSIEITK